MGTMPSQAIAKFGAIIYNKDEILLPASVSGHFREEHIMFCTSCGTKNSVESNFCKQCGTKLEKAAPRISEEEFNRTLPEDEQISLLMERAYARRMAGDLAGATALCEQALQLHPESASAHSLLGQIYEQTGDKAKAIQEFETVLAHNPASIADRVKLDTLRNEEAMPLASKPPHIVMTSPPPTSSPNIFAMIGVGAALTLVGAVAAMQLRPNNSTAPSNSAPLSTGKSETPQTGTLSQTNGAQTPNSNPTQIVPSNAAVAANGTLGSQTPAHMGNPVPQTSFGAQPFAPQTQFNMPSQERIRTASSSVSTPDSGTQRPINTAVVIPPKTTGKSDSSPANSGSSRTRLDSTDGGVVEGENGNYVIKIDTSSLNGTKTAANTSGGTRVTPASTGGKEPTMSISMAKNTVAGSPRNGVLPNNSGVSGEARTAISMGRDLSQRGEYARAIAAYRKALNSAGDETGYVYQAIAKCYQNKGDNNSAITNYELAIGEFQKLIEAGRGADNVQAALRICQNGIKACKNE
jgi:tetratricopeptide (TPR) repeat protein